MGQVPTQSLPGQLPGNAGRVHGCLAMQRESFPEAIPIDCDLHFLRYTLLKVKNGNGLLLATDSSHFSQKSDFSTFFHLMAHIN